MSFSVSVDRGAFEYRARATRPAGAALEPAAALLSAHGPPRSSGSPRGEGARGLRRGRARPASASSAGGYSRAFRDDFLLPMVACIWSSNGSTRCSSYPGRHDGRRSSTTTACSICGDRPQWRTVTGGSREYVRRSWPASTDVRTRARPWSRCTRRPRRRDRARCDRTPASGSTTWCSPPTPIPRSSMLGADASRRGAEAARRASATSENVPCCTVIPRSCRAAPGVVELELPGAAVRRTPDAERGVSLTYWMNLLQNLRDRPPGARDPEPDRGAARRTSARYRLPPPAVRRRAVEAQAAAPRAAGRRRDMVLPAATRASASTRTGSVRGCGSRRALGAPPRGGETRSSTAPMTSDSPSRSEAEPAMGAAVDRGTERARLPVPISGASGLYRGRVMHSDRSPDAIGCPTASGTCSPTSTSCPASTARSPASPTTARRR